MELNSFKAILLRKADSHLQTLIKNMREEDLLESVFESLEKMAKPTARMGLNANGPLTSFGTNLDTTDIRQLRDALGHHLSHYRAALKAHYAAPNDSEKNKMRQVADQHLEHVVPLMHLAGRASAHSKGKLTIDYPDVPPWETNYTTLERSTKNPERLRRDPKSWGVRAFKNTTRDAPNSTAIPDYRFFEMPAHPGHDDVPNMTHTGGYPWEEIQVGSPADVDAKKAFLHIEDVPDKKEYTPHEFDKHPIRNVADIPNHYLSPTTLQSHVEEIKNWRSGEHHKQWLTNQKEKFTNDKEGYLKRGHQKGAHFYDGIPLLEQPPHVHTVPVKQKKQKELPTTSAVAQPPTIRRASETAAAPTTKKAAHEEEMEQAYKAWKMMPAKFQNIILQSNTQLANYIASKGGK